MIRSFESPRYSPPPFTPCEDHTLRVSPSYFIYNHSAPKWGQGVPILDIQSIEDFISCICGIGTDEQHAQQVEHVLVLGGEVTPQLERELIVCSCQRCNKIIFECLDHPFAGLDSMVVRLDQLQISIVLCLVA